MHIVILSIHLLVCICLIGLVLLQRSEGGALGMGGGGGSLMSGRGAADALAKMTQVAGFFFLVTSLALTVISGAASSNAGRSVFDVAPQSAPAQSAPATPSPAPQSPAPQQPDPTESQAAPASQLASAVLPGPARAEAAAPVPQSAARAAPLETRASPPASNNTPARTTPTSAPATTRPASSQRPANAATRPASGGAASPPLVLPNTSGGAALTLDNAQLEPESGDAARLEAVRRERAGPDQ